MPRLLTTTFSKSVAQLPNNRANADLHATLLGQLSNIRSVPSVQEAFHRLNISRFQSVSDRFLGELQSIREGKIGKDDEVRFEFLLRGLKHLQIKVWPPEAFEDAADFLVEFSQAFANAHGQRLKIAFAESLVQLLHPIGKVSGSSFPEDAYLTLGRPHRTS